MVRLLILRHMKTGWALPGQRDIDRRLDDTGRQDLSIVRNWISEHNLQPGQIFCSTATRTRQTLDGILPAFTEVPELEFLESMYTGFTDEYLDCLKAHGRAKTIMMVGHNPTCASLANALAGRGDPQAMETLSYKFPTGALAIIDFDSDNWSDIREGSGHLTRFLIPKLFRSE